MTIQLLNDRYQVIQVLGAGGFGETFLAEDTYMPSKRHCVVKQLRPIQNNPQIYQLVQERFQREAAILEALGGASDQIPALYAYFCAEGEFYLVQEWIEGDTLSAKIQKQGLFTELAVTELLLNLLPVLSYVHSQHIVHRDIKPDNIIIRHRDGKPVLIDFGAVRESMGTVVTSQGNPTSSIVIGTPGYMPSEQAAGRPVYSSDLYSLGMTAIYLLTGRSPQQLEIDPETAEVVWRQYANHVNPVLLDVLDRSIAYHPRDRYSHAKAMLEALQGVTHTIAPTQPLVIAPTVASVPPPKITHETAITQPPTVSVAPAAVAAAPIDKNNQPKNNNQNTLLLGGLIAGGLIGSALIISQVINRNIEYSTSTKSAPNALTTPGSAPPSERQDIPEITTTTEPQVASQPPIQNPVEQAIQQNQAPTKSLISKTVNTNSIQQTTIPENVNNYAWLSQRLVTEADLIGKDGYELDIMRNTIFAVHGRQFETAGLQDYFNQQPWYSPTYSPKEFPMKLLSQTEMRNVELINQYQTRNNLRYFK